MICKLFTVVAITALLTGCGQKGEQKLNDISDAPIEGISTPDDSTLVKDFNSDKACRFAIEIALRDMNATKKMSLSLKDDRISIYEMSTESDNKTIECHHNDSTVFQVSVGQSQMPKSTMQSTYISPSSYTPINDLAHHAGARLSDDGGLIAFYTILETELPAGTHCLFTRYKAPDSANDSIFISQMGGPFESVALPISGDEIFTHSYTLAENEKDVVIRVKDREKGMIYGFEIKPCE